VAFVYKDALALNTTWFAVAHGELSHLCRLPVPHETVVRAATAAVAVLSRQWLHGTPEMRSRNDAPLTVGTVIGRLVGLGLLTKAQHPTSRWAWVVDSAERWDALMAAERIGSPVNVRP
jgi:hypothetical protein